MRPFSLVLCGMSKKRKLVVFTGAGVSAESGISTFRDSGGLWEKHDINEIATPEAFARNPELVLRFYNQRWADLKKVQPNAAHKIIAELENMFDVSVITQNVDDLHERAGSTKVLHLHGQLNKCRSAGYPDSVFDMPEAGLTTSDRCPEGHPLRPHIVWFGEMVPEMDRAVEWVSQADVLLVVGTSLAVYPAAGLVYAAPKHAEIHLVDPGDFDHLDPGINHIREKASTGVERFARSVGYDSKQR